MRTVQEKKGPRASSYPVRIIRLSPNIHHLIQAVRRSTSFSPRNGVSKDVVRRGVMVGELNYN
jgi:hypothetical protein